MSSPGVSGIMKKCVNKIWSTRTASLYLLINTTHHTKSFKYHVSIIANYIIAHFSYWLTIIQTIFIKQIYTAPPPPLTVCDGELLRTECDGQFGVIASC